MAEHRTGTSAYTHTFTYDGVGNRLTQMAADGATTTYTYNPASELLGTELGGALTTFAYDAVGNTTAEIGEASTTYTWDAENRLIEVDSAGSAETYTYDGSTSVPGKVTGLRRSKTTVSGTTQFVWDGQNVLAELDGALERVAQYTDFPGRWGGLASQRRSSASSFFGFDLSANTRALLDGGDVTDRYLYRAFGVEAAAAGSTGNSLRFGGQDGYWRDQPERMYVRARYYHPAIGRWLSADPLAMGPGLRAMARKAIATTRMDGLGGPALLSPSPGSCAAAFAVLAHGFANGAPGGRYGYVDNRPVLLADALGLQAESAVGAAVMALLLALMAGMVGALESWCAQLSAGGS